MTVFLVVCFCYWRDSLGFLRTLRFITVFTRADYETVCWVIWIQPTPSHSISEVWCFLSISACCDVSASYGRVKFAAVLVVWLFFLSPCSYFDIRSCTCPLIWNSSKYNMWGQYCHVLVNGYVDVQGYQYRKLGPIHEFKVWFGFVSKTWLCQQNYPPIDGDAWQWHNESAVCQKMVWRIWKCL
jgi:hypothetical protein